MDKRKKEWWCGKTFDKESKKLIIYEIKSIKSKIIPHVNGNNISFDVNIESEGRLSENWIQSGKDFENEFLKREEKAIEKEVKHLVHHVTKNTKRIPSRYCGFWQPIKN